MDNMSENSSNDIKIIDFGSIPVDTVAEKIICITNFSAEPLTYRVSLLYILNSIDHVFKVSITSSPVKPQDRADLKILYKPNIAGQSFTEYYLVDDTAENSYRLTVTGKCFGPEVSFSKRDIKLMICRNVSEQRKEVIHIINRSAMDTTYQWLLPPCGLFQISTGNCGLIRAYETITATVMFRGSALGVYIAELVCLVLNQEPLFLNVVAIIFLHGNPLFKMNEHIFQKHFKSKCRSCHLMENSLNRLTYIPAASAYERYMDFGTGSVNEVTLNISQTLCVTNHENEDGYIQWVSDPENVFLVDPVATTIPPKESRLFTIRFRPKNVNEVYSYLMCGDYQSKVIVGDDSETVALKHTWFRIPCIGNTWLPCTEWTSEWNCPTEVVMPPTVPTRTTFTNFMLSNTLYIPMCFKFGAPQSTCFVVMPMCGVVQSRGWQIISVALEPKDCGEYYENWDLVINKSQKVRICFSGNAESSQIDMMSHGFDPSTHGLYEFPPTITGCTNYATAFIQNLTRMEIHMRILNSVDWLGADNSGSIVLPPKEIIRYQWWFFPKTPDKVYDTTITCSCICLINGRPVGEPTEVFIHILGFSELPDLRVIPNKTNLHDIVVGQSEIFPVTIYNYCSCFFTSKLYFTINGMGDDHSTDTLEIVENVNSLKPSNHCEVNMTVTPNKAGSRQVEITYSVLFRNENDEVEEIQPVVKSICTVWYDGIYPTPKVKRTISVKGPVILSNHCIWDITNVKELNKAFEDCRPNNPLKVQLYVPDLGVRSESVKIAFVLGCVYQVPVPWTLRRKKICDCDMIEVQKGISTYELKHTCVHRPLAELTPSNGVVMPDSPCVLNLRLAYTSIGLNTLCYVMSLPNDRSIYIYINMLTHNNSKGLLTPLRRLRNVQQYLAVLDCGRVPINNLDPVIRILWFYNPTDVFTTWRLLRGNNITPDSVVRCLLYFAEVPPLGKLSIPFAFMPTEMIDYEFVFLCSFGYEIVKILVKGEGGLPNCVETRLDIPSYVERHIRSALRTNLVHLSHEHLTIPVLPTHSLSRDIIALVNDTDHSMRFIWVPERIPNIVNIVMTPCWGVLQPKTTEWITMTVYTLQEPATFTTTVGCEVLDLTERRRYQQNELLRKTKAEKCHQEFIITEKGMFYPNINDFPPYVLDLTKPQPFYLAMTVSVSSKGQRDGYPRMLLKQMWEQPPPYDMLSSDHNDYNRGDKSSGNTMTTADIIRVIDGILWDALHSKLFKNQIEFFSSEEIPTPDQLIKEMENEVKPKLSKRVTAGICDAIVNKAVYHIYGLTPKNEMSILEAE